VVGTGPLHTTDLQITAKVGGRGKEGWRCTVRSIVGTIPLHTDNMQITAKATEGRGEGSSGLNDQFSRLVLFSLVFDSLTPRASGLRRRTYLGVDSVVFPL
jgi:hypothetical protein